MGLKIPFVLMESGDPIHVDQYTPAAGQIHCPGCKGPISYVSPSKPHTHSSGRRRRVILTRAYFRHKAGAACSDALETTLHAWAKSVIEEALTIGLPIRPTQLPKSDLPLEDQWTYTHVTLEPWQEGIRPDIVLHRSDGGSVNVEIYVTHQVDPAKIAFLKERRISCVEIDLSNVELKDVGISTIRNAILRTAPRSWLSHELGDITITPKVISADDPAVIAAQAQLLLQSIKKPTSCLEYEEKNALEDEIALYRLEPYVGLKVRGSHWFSEADHIWQYGLIKTYLMTTILWRDAKTPIAIDNIPLTHDRHGLKYLREYPLATPAVLAAAELDPKAFASPLFAVSHYFRALRSGQSSSHNPKTVPLILDEGDLGHVLVNPEWIKFARNLKRVQIAFDEIVRGNRKSFPPFSIWAHTSFFKEDRTPYELINAGKVDYFRLLAELDAIINMRNGGRAVDISLGLVAPKWRNHRRRSTDLSRDRFCGYEPHNEWDWSICPSAELARQKMEPRVILKAMAHRLYKNDAKAAHFLNSPRDDLGGSTPIDFTVDIATAQRCIEIIDKETADPKRPPRLW